MRGRAMTGATADTERASQLRPNWFKHACKIKTNASYPAKLTVASARERSHRPTPFRSSFREPGVGEKAGSTGFAGGTSDGDYRACRGLFPAAWNGGSKTIANRKQPIYARHVKVLIAVTGPSELCAKVPHHRHLAAALSGVGQIRGEAHEAADVRPLDASELAIRPIQRPRKCASRQGQSNA